MTRHDEQGIIAHAKVKELKKTHTKKQISEKLGINLSAAYRMSDESFKPFETGARYFSDFQRGKEWFYGI